MGYRAQAGWSKDLIVNLTASDARHLLRRTGFGGLPAEVDELTGKTRAQAVELAVSGVGYTSHLGVPPPPRAISSACLLYTSPSPRDA